MAESKDHVLVLPKVVMVLRRIQLATAIAVLGLMAYGLTFLTFDGDQLMLFTSIATIIITIYIIIATRWVPSIYNYWAILSLDIFAIIFWLASFALLASEVAQYQIVTYDTTTCDYYYYGYCVKKRSMDLGLGKRATTNVYTYRNSMAAASGLGGLEFLLFIITLIFTSLYTHRHRKAGKHSTPTTSSSDPEPGQIEANYEPSFVTTAIEPNMEVPNKYTEATHSVPVYEHQNLPAQPMTAAGTIQDFAGAQPAYA